MFTSLVTRIATQSAVSNFAKIKPISAKKVSGIDKEQMAATANICVELANAGISLVKFLNVNELKRRELVAESLANEKTGKDKKEKEAKKAEKAEKKLKKKAKELEEAVAAGKVSLTDVFNDLRATISESVTTIKTGLKVNHEEVTDVTAKDVDSEKVTEVTAQEPAPQAAATEAQAQSVQLDPQTLLNAMTIEQKREMLEALMSVDYTAAPAPAPVTVVNTDESGTASPEALKALAESVNGGKRKNRNQ